VERIKLHDKIKVNRSNHPMYGLRGKVVGIRGEIEPGNFWLLIYFPSHQRSFLVPEIYVEKE
jgi:hypothetical protein